jgi:hypothetical protein
MKYNPPQGWNSFRLAADFCFGWVCSDPSSTGFSLCDFEFRVARLPDLGQNHTD